MKFFDHPKRGFFCKSAKILQKVRNMLLRKESERERERDNCSTGMNHLHNPKKQKHYFRLYKIPIIHA